MYFATTDGRVRGSRSEHADYEALTDFLTGQAASWPTPVVFVAGHFMLMYSALGRKLVPMLSQELEVPTDRAFVQARVGDFPMLSLGIAARVMAARPEMNARIALLVNDHQFSRFQLDLPPNQAGVLRRQFYREWPHIPASFERLLREANLDPERTILCNDMPPRKGRGILPRVTPYFSEYNLRNCFRGSMQRKALESSRFAVQAFDGVHRVVHRVSCLVDSTLTGDGLGCNCSGEVLQFFHQMSMPDKCHHELHRGGRPVATVVMLVPDECFQAVLGGAVAGLDIGGNVEYAVVVSGISRDLPIEVHELRVEASGHGSATP